MDVLWHIRIEPIIYPAVLAPALQNVKVLQHDQMLGGGLERNIQPLGNVRNAQLFVLGKNLDNLRPIDIPQHPKNSCPPLHMFFTK